MIVNLGMWEGKKHSDSNGVRERERKKQLLENKGKHNEWKVSIKAQWKNYQRIQQYQRQQNRGSEIVK